MHRKRILIFGIMLVAIVARASDSVDANIRVSVVSQNGMPKNIVKPGNKWNFGPGSLWTHKGWQYAAYWDDACQVSVARRKLPRGKWSVASLPGYQRTASGDRGHGGKTSQGFGDGHEKVSMGISPDGVIHLAFDHHLSRLHYRTSITAVANHPAAHEWSSELFGPVQSHLGDQELKSVTYPSFASDGEHFALYLRLGGGSGGANSHFFAYENGSWSINTEADSQFIDKKWSGGDGTVNAYPHAMVIHNGRRHMTWCWRDTPVATTCHDLCYVYSDDNGETWKNNAGKVVAVTGAQCITADTQGIAVWEIPPGTKYVNGGSMTVDSKGRVHVLVRGEKGTPVYFQRDPRTRKWSRWNIDVFGKLIPEKGDRLYIVSERGIWGMSAKHPGKTIKLSSSNTALFSDSRMSVDATRPDGWISVIGQVGKTISVVDYRVGK